MPDPTVGVIGASLVGGLMGGGSDTVTQQTQLPDFLQPYAPLYAQMGYNLTGLPFNPYPYETVAPFTQDQNTGMDMVRAQALGGQNPLFGAAQQQTMDTIGGQYLDPASNPWLQQTYDQAAGRVTDAFSRGTAAQTDARFARAGAFGGSAWDEAQQANQQVLGDSLAGMAANLYGGNYQAERGRQQQAAQFAPSLAQNQSAAGYRDAEALLNVGGMQQQLGQQYLADDLSRYTQAQQYPYQQFQQFGAMFNPALGSSVTQTTPGVGTAQGLLGGALGGLGLYNMGQQAGIWGSGGGGGLLGSATTGAAPSLPYMGGGTGVVAPAGFSWGAG